MFRRSFVISKNGVLGYRVDYSGEYEWSYSSHASYLSAFICGILWILIGS